MRGFAIIETARDEAIALGDSMDEEVIMRLLSLCAIQIHISINRSREAIEFLLRHEDRMIEWLQGRGHLIGPVGSEGVSDTHL